MNRSLRRQLLAWLLLPLAVTVALDSWLTYRSSVETASVVQDRLLLGSARMIAQQISFEDGTFQHQIPPAALELFQSPDSPDRIFYRVTTGAGKLLSGYTDLPLPAPGFASDAPFFFDATMRDHPVRVAAYFQPVIGNPSALPVIVEVGQTLQAHQLLTHKLWMHALGQQLLILAVAAIFILYGLRRGLQPLIRLRNDVRSRKEGSLQPLQTDHIPSELISLVDAFNDYIQRLESYTLLVSSFVQNAAHQLRTPLAIMQTQISDALRADSKEGRDASLLTARRTVQQTTRLVNQFLALSSAETHAAGTLALSTQQCSEIVQQAVRDLALQAYSKAIDLGFERTGQETTISLDPSALREIALNLIDNAIRYTPPNGVVTVRVRSTEGQIALAVEDNGPGVATEHWDKIFQRFYRIEGSGSSGSGLGLAIVKELAAQCGGVIRVGMPAGGGSGLVVTVDFS